MRTCTCMYMHCTVHMQQADAKPTLDRWRDSSGPNPSLPASAVPCKEREKAGKNSERHWDICHQNANQHKTRDEKYTKKLTLAGFCHGKWYRHDKWQCTREKLTEVSVTYLCLKLTSCNLDKGKKLPTYIRYSLMHNQGKLFTPTSARKIGH